MLKLNASYSKKVPAEGEYSSQSYHASIEVELPDGLTSEQLNGKIHETFEMVKNSVESELHGKDAPKQAGDPIHEPAQKDSQGYPSQHPQNSREVPASPKQVSYMLSLAQRRGVTPQQIATQYGVANVQQLSKRQCSALINSWRAA